MASAAAASTSRRPLPQHDRTGDFRQLVSQSQAQYPPASSSRKAPRSEVSPNVLRAQRQWLAQAYIIRRHIVSLLAFLYSIRRQYLALTSSKSHRPTSAAARHAGTPDDQAAEPASSSAFDKWRAYQGPLTDQQRDEIDFQVKVVVKRCLDSVKELELAEEARKKNAPTVPSALSPLNTLLSLSMARDSSSSIFASSMISAHRASITHYLSTLLSKASALQSDMQERRLKAQREKTRSLANSRAQMLAEQQAEQASAGAGSGGSAAPVPIRGSVGGSFDPALEAQAPLVGHDISSQLSAAQIEMFEFESSELIKALESDLAAIKKAESRLYEISDLQTQVAQQLEQQGEVTDCLLDEAIGINTEVGKGNEELRKALERSREADKMLAVFLVGSGLALLFLHWMD